jgi:CarboxypepD_reg-like domain
MLVIPKTGIKATLALCLISLLTSMPVVAQKDCEILISAQFNNEKLEKILDSISLISDLRFSFNTEIIPKSTITSFSCTDLNICSALDSLLGKFELKWTRVENQIVITSRLNQVQPLEHNDIPTFLKLTGKIIDITDLQPIPYAYIRLLGKTFGTITNEDGEFVFKYPKSDDRDIIVISCLGFKTVSMPVTDLVDGKIWQLHRESILLKEVVIRSNDPKAIIRKAIEAIPGNYRTTPASETGFYRETLQKNGHYIVLSEAVVNINKSSYSRPGQMDQAKVFKGRKTADIRQYDTVLFKVQGGLYNCLMLDIVKHIPSFMDENSFSLYDYKMGMIQKVNDEMAYSIEFDQRDGIQDPYFKGKLLIEVNSLTILGAEFSISPKAIENSASLLVRRAPIYLKVKPVSVDYIVNYANIDGKWQLNHIRIEMQIRVRKKSNFFNSLYTSIAEMVITATDTLPVKPFRLSEIARSNEVFVEHVGPYDPDFWGEYNYIKPEEKLEETLLRLFSKNTN